ncbi:uncharacterized protein (TIGR02646 family) [Sphingomonas faeni]|uniref:Uncharacterized protein (TIGR02646 family) n=1 Tax=Sphingomonas faeni TaxID=185950 RepID=A0A2T5TWV5_9SPHN|nr:hypothetical protein [Sphingomonas faeni]PTW43701.1 uncharacterized protein (TIGR02646 family) [Sphingomonas faeni]
MIYIYQDVAKIPVDWLDTVAAYQAELEGISTKTERVSYIGKKQGVWGIIKDQLLAMSHNKCWYSEAPDAVSDWHVDHFRPKSRALDADRTPHDGYMWLAFDWKNYRIAGSYPNSPHKDGKGVTRGKWDYFPLSAGSVRATWAQRSTAGEIVLLLDPTNKNDPKLMTFDEEGIPAPADPRNAIIKKRVETTVHYLYLDSPRLIAARKKKWREVSALIEEYHLACPEDYDSCTDLDHLRVERLAGKLSLLASPHSAYAATARACLRANALDWMIERVEEAAAA